MGMENNFMFERRRLAWSNVELVARGGIVRSVRSLRRIVSGNVGSSAFEACEVSRGALTHGCFMPVVRGGDCSDAMDSNAQWDRRHARETGHERETA